MPEFERLKNSIETFGNVEPIVWNERTGHIVGGHQRLAVLQHLGYTSAEVSVVDLDEKEEKLLNVALNKIKGQWDYSRLEEIFQEYELEEAKVTGFTGQEIALILAKNDDVEDPAAWHDDEEDEEDEDPDFLGASWVVTLTFRSSRDAQRCIDRMGYDAIRMEERRMDFYEGLASYKRPEASRTLDYLDSLGFPKERRILSVQTEEDRDAYTRSGLNERVGTFLYREASTAAGNRNTILLNVPEGTNVVFMDDDIKQVVMEDLGLAPRDTLETFERMRKLG